VQEACRSCNFDSIIKRAFAFADEWLPHAHTLQILVAVSSSHVASVLETVPQRGGVRLHFVLAGETVDEQSLNITRHTACLLRGQCVKSGLSISVPMAGHIFDSMSPSFSPFWARLSCGHLSSLVTLSPSPALLVS
jgi:hypothetical protein